jgi:surface-anchored protein
MKPASLILTVVLGVLWGFLPTVSAHTHLEVVYREGQLRLLYYDFDTGEADPAEVLLYVGLPAAIPIPNLPAFTNMLGEAGATTWVLPQTQKADLPWLGIGTGTLRSAYFIGDLQLTLHSVEGPGHFALFLTDAFGQPITLMNSRDGVSAQDTMAVPLGSHIHCNWAFSAPGVYRVRLIVSGTLRSGNTPIASLPTDCFFEVAPPPQPVLALARTATNTFQLTLQAHPGLNYAIERTATFTNWLPLTNVPASNPVTTHLLAMPPAPIQFFRARLR